MALVVLLVVGLAVVAPAVVALAVSTVVGPDLTVIVYKREVVSR